MQANNITSVKAAYTGLMASGWSWAVGSIKWYATNLNMITSWMVHVAQIGGLVIMVLSIRILYRNLRRGDNSVDAMK